MNRENILYQYEVLNVEDPLMLGRIRARELTDNYQDIINSITNPPWNEEKDAWSIRDPFVIMPLLPYYLYQVPKPNEMVLVLYTNPNNKFINRYYVQSTIYSPTSSSFQYYQGGNKFTGTGTQIAPPKPLKNQNGTYTDKEIHKGVFPEPGDNSLLGRGSADIIVKENDVLIRAGKFKGSSLEPNVIPVANQKRGFLQISKFNSTKEKKPNKTILEQIENVQLVKYLIEYGIVNPENTLDKFSGSIYLYKLKPDTSVNTKNISPSIQISNTLKQLVTVRSFSALSKIETINFINAFISETNNGTISVGGVNAFNTDNRFPIYYRPTTQNYSFLSSGGVIQKNMSDIFKGITLTEKTFDKTTLQNTPSNGYGLIYSKNKIGTPYTLKKTTIEQSTYTLQSNVTSAWGADKLYLLSQNSAIPNKGKINFDDTLYGISSEKFIDEIEPKTSSLVRGEELLELINLIVRYLITHTHAYPGLPPIPITQDGTNSADILAELQNAVNKILNKNIRLN
jgi:hypothetical protein